MLGLLALACLATVRARAVASGKDGLQVEVTREEDCKVTQQAEKGDKVTVHYGGFLQDGKKFDSSFDRQQPFTFTMGVGQVIPGWDQGLLSVCPGEERHLVVPASLAYGDRGAGDVIPPGAILLFDIVVVNVEKEGAEEENNSRRNEEEDRRIAEQKERERAAEEEKRRKEDEARAVEEMRRAQQLKAQEEEELRRREEQLRREEEEELRKKQVAEREEEEQRRRQEIRRREEAKRRSEEAAEKKRLEEEIARKEAEIRREEAEVRREEQRRREEEERGVEQESQRRQEYEDEEEYYYYDYESSCEPGQLKVQVTDKPARCSRKSRNSDQLTMHYTGKLSSGTKFDSSVDRNKPFQFTLGVGQVIAGWDEGLLGMCVGERRTLVIPPALAYGEEGVGSVIPACSVLVFEVELLDIAN